MKEIKGCESPILLKGERENAMRFLDASCSKKKKTPRKVPESFFFWIVTLPKNNMEPKNEGLVQMISFSNR